MSELIELAKALSPWPVIDAIVVAIIAFASLYVTWQGNRERKMSKNVELPGYLMWGPGADAIKALLEIREAAQTRNFHVDEIRDELRQQTQLLEDIRNALVMNGSPRPRR